MNNPFENPASNSNENMGSMAEQLRALTKSGALKPKQENEAVTKDDGVEQKPKSNKKDVKFHKAKKFLGEIVSDTIKNIDMTQKDQPKISLSEIKEVVADARKLETRTAHDITKINNDKQGLLFTLADLRVKASQAGKEGLSKWTRSRLDKEIARVQKLIDEINGATPEIDSSDDHKKVQEIINEYRTGQKKLRDEAMRLAKAEKGLAKNPEDGHLQGEANRARAELHETVGILDETIDKAESLEESKSSHPVQDEGITYTHEQSLTDKKPRTKDTGTEKVAPGIFGNKVENAQMQREMDTLSRGKQPEKVLEITNQHEGVIENIEEEGRGIVSLDTRNKQEIIPATTALEIAPHMELVPTENIQSSEAPLGTPWQNQEGAFEKFEAKTAEQEHADLHKERTQAFNELFTGKLQIIEGLNKGVDARAEKVGMTEKFFRMAERFNTFKKEHKYAYTALMILAGTGSLATGTALAGGAVGTISGVLRFITGVGVFYAKEKHYEHKAEKEGRERTKAERGGDRLKAVAWGVVMGGLLSYVLGEVVQSIEGKTPDSIWGGEKAMNNALDKANAEQLASVAVTTPAQEIGTDSGATGTMDLEKEKSIATSNISNLDFTSTAEPGDSVWKLTNEQLAKISGSRFTELTEVQQAHVVDAIKDRIARDPAHFGIASGDANVLAVGDNVNFEEIFKDKEFMDAQFGEAEQVSEIETSETKPTTPTETTTPTIEHEGLSNLTGEEFYKTPTEFIAPVQEITPNDPQVIAYADHQVRDHLTTLFGSKGFLGFGAKEGIESISWKDPEIGFSGKTIQEIMDATPSTFPEDGERHFGIENKYDTEKMKNYIRATQEATGVVSLPGENVLEYIKRAEEILISRLMNKG